MFYISEGSIFRSRSSDKIKSCKFFFLFLKLPDLDLRDLFRL
jgi:hypothetical protein